MGKYASLKEESPKIVELSYIKDNVDWARRWYKSLTLSPRIKFSLSDAGGPINGTIKNGLLIICYLPPLGYPVPNCCQSLDTTLFPEEFQGRAIRALEAVQEHTWRADIRVEEIERNGGLEAIRKANMKKRPTGFKKV